MVRAAADEIERLRALTLSLADRCEEQSELLARRSEKATTPEDDADA